MSALTTGRCVAEKFVSIGTEFQRAVAELDALTDFQIQVGLDEALLKGDLIGLSAYMAQLNKRTAERTQPAPKESETCDGQTRS